MPPTASTSIKVSFYDGAGTLNPDYYGQLCDNRTDFSLLINGDSSKVLTAKLFVDSDATTGSATQKQFACQMGSATTVALTGSTGHNAYDFANNGLYALKAVVVLNETGYQTLFGRFSVGGAPETSSYTYRYETAINTFASATVTNPTDIQNDGTINVSVPFNPTINSADTRRPEIVVFTFDVIEGGADTDNREALQSYSVVQGYAPLGAYTLNTVKLANHNKYLMSVMGVFSDGFTVNKNVEDPIRVVKAPVIKTLIPYGMGLDGVGAGDDSISSVMDVTMETEETGNFSSGSTILFRLSQGESTFYTYEVNVKTGTNPVYNILKSDLSFTANSSPVQSNVNGKKFYRFNVTAFRTYDNDLEKVSAPVSGDFTLDITPVPSVSLYNLWSKVAVNSTTYQVTIDSEVTQAKWDSLAECGVAGKFSKTPFFGTGKVGLYSDLDKTSTQFKFEISSDGGQNFAALTSLRLCQGLNASSDGEDRTNWVRLLDYPVLSNSQGLYDNITWHTPVLGQNQPNMYFLANCPQNASAVIKVSIVAQGATLPGGTSSNVVKVMNKVNTPVTQNAYYSILNNKLYVAVDDNIATSNDKLMSVLFTSNLDSPNDLKVVQKPSGNTNNIFTFEVASPDKRGLSNPALFQVKHTVDDDNNTSGSDLTGLAGPVTSVVCYNPPTKENFVISNVYRKTKNDNNESSFDFNVAFNDNNNATIKGLRAYFFAANVPKVFVKDVLVEEQTAPVTLTLSDKSFYSSWTNLSAGTLEFVPLYDDNDLDGTAVVREVPSEQKTYQIYKVEPIDSTPADLTGGVIQQDTTLTWSGDSGSAYSLFDGATELSSGIAANGSIYSYTFLANSLSQGQAMNLALKKKHTLPVIPENLTGFGVSGTPATFKNFTGSEPVVVSRNNRGVFTATENVTVTSLLINASAAGGLSYYIGVQKFALVSGLTYQSSLVYETTYYRPYGQNIGDINVPIPSVVLNAGEQLNVDYIGYGGDHQVRALAGNALPLTVGYTKPAPAPLDYGAPELIQYGPRTTIDFTAISVDTATMAVAIKRNSNTTQLVSSHSDAALSHPVDTNITLKRLCINTLPLAFSSGPGSTATKQVGFVENIYDLPGDSVGSLLNIRMTVEAGVAYSAKVGSGNTVNLNSSSVILDQGPIKQYRVGGKPIVTNRSVVYTVENNKIKFPLCVNTNGLWEEGVSSITAICVQDSDFTDASDLNAGNGGTVIVTFTPGAPTKSYDVGSAASANDATDNLAPLETRIAPSEDLSDGVRAIESSECTIQMGDLRSNDTTWLSIPDNGFDTTKPINVMVIVACRLGSAYVSFVASSL